MEEFLNFVAGVFDVDPSELSMNTEYGSYEPWDSLMMLRLIMEVEEKFGCVIPIEEAPKIKTLEDLYGFTVK